MIPCADQNPCTAGDDQSVAELGMRGALKLVQWGKCDHNQENSAVASNIVPSKPERETDKVQGKRCRDSS